MRPAPTYASSIMPTTTASVGIFPQPDDIRALGMDVLRHRVILSYEAEAENITSEDVVRRIFDVVEVP